MNKGLKKPGVWALLLAMIAMLLPCGIASASEIVDMTRTGSISVTMAYDGQAITDGSLALYRVGDVAVDDGDYTFVLNESFADSGIAVDDIESADTAEQLAQYAQDHSISATVQNVDATGTVTFADLEVGLYLVTQQETCEGYKPISPFLVSVPLNDSGTYVYDVDATAKMSLEKEPSESQTPEEDTETSTGTLPQTGTVIMLAVAVLLCAVVLISVASAIRAKR